MTPPSVNTRTWRNNPRRGKLKSNSEKLETIQRVFRKLRYKTIADMLSISEQAVRNYLKSQGLVKQVKKTKKYKTAA